MPDLVARRTITTIQEGSKYRERYLLPDAQPEGTTVRQVFFDSAGGEIGDPIEGSVDGRTITFDNSYADVEAVPNGAGFYCYIQRPEDVAADDEVMVRYGTTFRRQLTFPNSPAEATSTVVRQFEDSFQRPAGAVGGRWKVLIGNPRIFDNTEWFGLGNDHPNTVGPDVNWFTNYFMYYYQPFNDDTVELTISATKKGGGTTIVSLCQNSQASSYRYVGFNGWNNNVVLGYGTSPDIGTTLRLTGALQPQITPVSLTVPGNDGMATYKISYDKVTKELAFWNADRTDKIASWVDSDDMVPEGRGYRYFGIGGDANLLDSGVQLAYIKAQGRV